MLCCVSFYLFRRACNECTFEAVSTMGNVIVYFIALLPWGYYSPTCNLTAISVNDPTTVEGRLIFTADFQPFMISHFKLKAQKTSEIVWQTS